jgi:hypothetical protein
MSHESLPVLVSRPRPLRLALPLLVGGAFLVAVVLDVPTEIRGPAPYPPEWQWSRRTEPWSDRLVPIALGAAALLALLAASDSAWARGNDRTRIASHVFLATGTLAGWGFSLALLGLEPAGALASVAGRVRSPSYTSYYTVAVSPAAEDPWAFLDRHAALLPTFREWAKHAATHPPGPVLFYRGLMALCARAPTLTGALLAAQGHDPLTPVRPPDTPASKAAALLGGLLLMLAGAAAAWPIASLAGGLSGDTLTGVRAGLLWLLLPGPVLFVPQFDQALTLLVAGAAALLAGAAAGRRPWLRAAAAGLLGGVAVYVSYGAAPMMAIAGLAALAAAVHDRPSLRRALTVAAVAGLALIATALLDQESMAAARTALRIHREAYTSVRSYALWLGFNLLDLAVFLGVPVAVLGLEQTTRALRAVFGGRSVAADRFTAAIALGLGALWLSGTTRGEVGRIWLPLMPLLLVAAWTPHADAPAPSRLDALLLGLVLAATSFTLRVYWIL